MPFFFKQWGGARKHKTGRVLEGRTYDGFPETVIDGGPTLVDRVLAVTSVAGFLRRPALVQLGI